MKTAVSIPDDIFKDAERLVSRMQISRSRLYAQALTEFVARHDDDRITASMNRIIDEVGPENNDFSNKAAQQTLRRVNW